jgi:hypothetical protein
LTVGEFALECQHPAKKASPASRLSACVSYLNAALGQIQLATKSEACRTEIESLPPLAVADALYALGNDPETRDIALSEAAAFIVNESMTKSCR